jgi:hypothetical protein
MVPDFPHPARAEKRKALMGSRRQVDPEPECTNSSRLLRQCVAAKAKAKRKQPPISHIGWSPVAAATPVMVAGVGAAWAARGARAGHAPGSPGHTDPARATAAPAGTAARD